MPNPTLMSQALYSLPTLSKELEELGYLPGAQGYQSLKDKFGAKVESVTPNVRTIQKLFRGTLIKYSLCDGVIRLLNVVRADKGLPLLDGTLIEEHEYWMPDLGNKLTRITKRTGKIRALLVKEIALESGKHTGLIHALIRKQRTTSDRCTPIQDAVKKLYGEQCAATNEAPIPRGPKGSRRSLHVVAKKIRDI